MIGWTATTAGICGEMMRDLMIGCVESRFATFQAPHQVQWLSDNGSIFAAARTLETATALGLLPCFTPVESPESNGLSALPTSRRGIGPWPMAEAFVRTFKRDYVRVNPIPDAATALAAIGGWINDYNEVHPHSRLGYRSPGEYIRAMAQPAACPV